MHRAHTKTITTFGVTTSLMASSETVDVGKLWG